MYILFFSKKLLSEYIRYFNFNYSPIAGMALGGPELFRGKAICGVSVLPCRAFTGSYSGSGPE